MTKKELKQFDILTLRNGDTIIRSGVTENSLANVNNKTGSMVLDLDRYNEDLTHSLNKDLDVIRVDRFKSLETISRYIRPNGDQETFTIRELSDRYNKSCEKTLQSVKSNLDYNTGIEQHFKSIFNALYIVIFQDNLNGQDKVTNEQFKDIFKTSKAEVLAKIQKREIKVGNDILILLTILKSSLIIDLLEEKLF